jgi:hypothetical protein
MKFCKLFIILPFLFLGCNCGESSPEDGYWRGKTDQGIVFDFQLKRNQKTNLQYITCLLYSFTFHPEDVGTNEEVISTLTYRHQEAGLLIKNNKLVWKKVFPTDPKRKDLYLEFNVSVLFTSPTQANGRISVLNTDFLERKIRGRLSTTYTIEHIPNPPIDKSTQRFCKRCYEFANLECPFQKK